MGEAIAHLHALAADGRLAAVRGADGVQRLRSATHADSSPWVTQVEAG